VKTKSVLVPLKGRCTPQQGTTRSIVQTAARVRCRASEAESRDSTPHQKDRIREINAGRGRELEDKWCARANSHLSLVFGMTNTSGLTHVDNRVIRRNREPTNISACNITCIVSDWLLTPPPFLIISTCLVSRQISTTPPWTEIRRRRRIACMFYVCIKMDVGTRGSASRTQVITGGPASDNLLRWSLPDESGPKSPTLI
jgi:hypothetical protein